MGKEEKFSSGKMLLIKTAKKILSKTAYFMINFFNYFMDSLHPQFPQQLQRGQEGCLNLNTALFSSEMLNYKSTDLLFYLLV